MRGSDQGNDSLFSYVDLVDDTRRAAPSRSFCAPARRRMAAESGAQMAVHDIAGVVDVERQAGRRSLVAVHPHVDHGHSSAGSHRTSALRSGRKRRARSSHLPAPRS
jgi:hypothetical protein